MAPLRFGLIGTGYWALHTHGTALAGSLDAELHGVWGRDPSKAVALAERLNARGYEDLDQMLASVDAVSLAVPPDVQPALAVQAANAGCHLLLEKPLALDVATAASVQAAVDRAGVAAIVFFTNRYRSDQEEWLQAACQGAPWKSAHLLHYANIFQPGSPYASSAWRRQYGALWDIGPHALACALPIMGPVTSLTAQRENGVGDTVHLLLSHNGPERAGEGGTTTLSLSLTMPPAAAVTQLAVYGEHGARVRPEGRFDVVEVFRRAVSELGDMVASGRRHHRCDVSFAVGATRALAAAQGSLSLPGVELT